MIKKTIISSLALAGLMTQACNSSKTEQEGRKPLSLVVVEPGHFHAALVQKTMYESVDSTVHVYATEGPEVTSYLNKIEKFNSRPEDPTHWNEKVYKGADFFEKMLAEKAGNIVVLAGNNQQKTDYIKRSVDAGLNVLADKPMAITSEGFDLLKEAFSSAEKNKVLLYDIMTERYEITNALQKELAHIPDIFGELQKGTEKEPAVVKESVHHFFKFVAGEPLIRPSWFFDVKQQGDGIVDVTTHLVDLIQWSSFPETTLDYQKDVQMVSSKRWATPMTPSQFKKVTSAVTYPEYLKKDVKDSILNVYSNGEINYKLKGVHSKVSVVWNFQAPEGTGDTHYSIMRGSKANLIIRQGKDQGFKPVLYIEQVGNDKAFEKVVAEKFKDVQAKFSGVELKKNSKGWEITIPANYNTGHEAHFGEVANKYMEFLKQGKLPEWEVPNMLTKYYITTQALKMATEK